MIYINKSVLKERQVIIIFFVIQYVTYRFHRQEELNNKT